jgi:selenocysteine lyase/cysteine desulfurase
MTNYSRRDFTRLLAFSGTAAFLPATFPGRGMTPDDIERARLPLPPTPLEPDEAFWIQVRAKFLVPKDLAFFNAANLCPTSLPVIEAIEKNIRAYEISPSPQARTALMRLREDARTQLATALRVTPEEIVITRNTTEGNNFISSGLKLGPGDDVVVSADNHPSNLNAWRVKATRFGFSVVTVDTPATHLGTQGYVDSFVKAFTPRTRIVAVTHVSSNSGDLLPAREICSAARERGVLAHVDGAQAFGVLDLNLAEMKPDFYTGSMHKWPCGPKEKGMFFVSAAVQDRISPTIVGLYGGAVGASRSFEAEGQRDDASIAAVSEALKFQGAIGRDVIEKRARALAAHLMTELRKLDGVQLWTDPAPDRSAAIVIFKPGNLDPGRLGTALTTNERIVVTTRGANGSRPGLRVSPHFYNTMADVDRFVGTIRDYLKKGV